MHNQQGTPIAASNILQFPVLTPDTMPSMSTFVDLRSGTCLPSRTPPALSPAAKLAHDARNALCSLHMLAGLLEEPGVLAPSAKRYAEDLQIVASTLTHLMETLTSPPESFPDRVPNSRPRRPSASTGEMLQDCQKLLNAAAGSLTAVHVSSESNLPRLALPEDAVERVLINLVKNASEALGTDGGTVRITGRRALSRDAPAVLIHVSDNGPGIPPHALGQIFEPGFTSKRHGSSAHGLGLTVVRKLVESVGGTVRVGSVRRRGTTFELRIPCIDL